LFRGERDESIAEFAIGETGSVPASWRFFRQRWSARPGPDTSPGYRDRDRWRV